MTTSSGPKTALAQIYTHPVGIVDGVNHGAIRDDIPFKSGLTPIIRNFNPTYQDLMDQEKLNTYQRDRFMGFTAAQLEAMQCLAFAEPEALPMNLDGLPIHNIFRRDNWCNPLPLHQGSWPLSLGRDGFWHADTALVWNVMQPSLRIATILLTNSQMFPWWDAFFFGARVRVERQDLPPDRRGEECYRYYRRCHAIANSDESRQRVQDLFVRIGNEIQFGIISGHANVDTGIPHLDDVHGITTPRTFWRRPICNINSYDIEPLLNPRLSSAERLLCQFELTSIILHEFCHALEFDRRFPDFTVLEGYFEDECLGEVGFSFENAIFGGLAARINEHTNAKGMPYAGYMLTEWNGIVHEHRRNGQPTLNNKPDKWLYGCAYPVPMEYLRNVHHPDFWNIYVRTAGQYGAYMAPLTTGSIWIHGQGWQEDLDEAPRRGDDPTIDNSMTDAEKTVVQLEIDRNRRAMIIQASINITTEQLEYQQRQLMNFRSADARLGNPPLPGRFKEPQFRPVCNDPGLIIGFLDRHRQELALDTLHFPIAEHHLYWYIVREGMVLQPLHQLSGGHFCYVVNASRLCSQHLQHPGPTMGVVTRIKQGWPEITPPTITVNPAWNQAYFRNLFDVWGRSMIFIGEGGYHYCFVEGQYDFDKKLLMEMVRHRMDEQGWVRGHITEDEFDECIRYCEFRDWRFGFGPKGIIRKTENGW